MTREEAIRVLGNLKLYHDDDNDILEACDTAIEALQENESLARSVNEASELLRKKRPHGEWLFVNHVDGEVEGVRMVDMLCECTVCHYRKLFPTRSYGVCVETKPYCENCGAYMRKEGEEE